MRAGAAVVLSLGLGCAGADSAIINTAIGAGVAGARRANGECYTPCTPGNTCNPQSGMCEPLPCRGECQLGESCELTPTGEKCVPAAAAAALELRTSSSSFKPGSGATDAGVTPTRPPSDRLLPR